MNQQACLKDGIQVDGTLINDLASALKSLTTASEKDFETIKNYPWYKRLFDMVTLSNNREIHLANQISSLAQAQNILIEILIRLAESSAEVSKLVYSAKQDIEKLSQHDLVLLKKIKTLENVSLDVKKDTDISTLSSREKCILSACLFKIAEMVGTPSQDQQDFASVVQRYIGESAQIKDPFGALATVEESARKKMLATCMQYMYLKSHSFNDIDEDVVCEFDLGGKTIKSIKEQIENVMRLNGVDGLLYRYQVDEVEDVGEIFDVELDDPSVKKGGLEPPEIGPSYEPKQRIDIDHILRILPGEVKYYENSEIHVKSFVKCEGSIEFKNCIIYYNEIAGGFNIAFADGAGVVIENCRIICKGNAENYFIVSDHIGYRPSLNASVKNSCLKDCAKFLSTSSGKISFDHCSFENCIQDVVNCSGDFFIRDCSCLWNADVAPFVDKSKGYWIFSCGWGKCIVENCRFERLGEIDEKIRKTLFSGTCDTISVKNCEFCNLRSVLDLSIYEGDRQNKTVLNSKFINCQEVLNGYKGLYLDNCIFEKCSYICPNSASQEFYYCLFVDITDVIANYTKAEFNYCEFFNISDSSVEDDFFYNGVFYLEEGSCLDHCIFDGISLEKGLLIKTLFDCKKEYAVSVKNSVFQNCYAKNGYLIERSKTIEGRIWDTHVKTPVSVYNCTGLDDIRSAPTPHSNYAIRTTNIITGDIIGLLKK